MATPVYGLTSAGFFPKNAAVILAELQSSWRNIFGTSLDVSSGTIEGQLLAILAEREARVWELAEAVYNAMNPDAATGAQLDNLCALTGTFRRKATHSSVVLTFTGNPAVVVPTGTQVSTVSTGSAFETTADAPATVTAAAWLATHPYSVDFRATTGGNVYQCTQLGVSGSTPPTSVDPAADIVDGTAHWRWLGQGTATSDAPAIATDTGPTVAISGDVRTIDTPVGGIEGAINVLDAALGNAVGTDEGTRILRETELEASGGAPEPALVAKLEEVLDVTAVTVFVNDSDLTNSDGMPPHSVEALVQGGADADIRAALYTNVATGIVTHGNTTGTVVNSQNQAKEVDFSRPVAVNVYVTISVLKDPAYYPLDGDDQIKAAIVKYGDSLPTGRDVVAAAVGAQAFAVAGVLDTPSVLIGAAPTPTTSTTIAITTRQLALFDTSRIIVIATNGTP